MTGMQALVRLPIQQRLRDAAAGLNTGGYISGYRGSPLGPLRHRIVARGGGAQAATTSSSAPASTRTSPRPRSGARSSLTSFPGATVDGVFGIWYGKGPGVDRSGDALASRKFHRRLAEGRRDRARGRRPRREIVDRRQFLRHVVHRRRHAGALSLEHPGTDRLRAARHRHVALFRLLGRHEDRHRRRGGRRHGLCRPGVATIVIPERPSNPPGGFGARAIDMPFAQEERLYNHKLPAALAYARANGLNRIVGDGADAASASSPPARRGRICCRRLAISASPTRRRRSGLRLLKVGMVWPLDPVSCAISLDGLDLIVVVEEKRPLIEDQIRSILYGARDAPRIVGKYFDGRRSIPPRAPQFPKRRTDAANRRAGARQAPLAPPQSLNAAERA